MCLTYFCVCINNINNDNKNICNILVYYIIIFIEAEHYLSQQKLHLQVAAGSLRKNILLPLASPYLSKSRKL